MCEYVRMWVIVYSKENTFGAGDRPLCVPLWHGVTSSLSLKNPGDNKQRMIWLLLDWCAYSDLVLHYIYDFFLTSRQSYDTPFSSITGASDIIVVFLWLISHSVTISACCACSWRTATASSSSITTSTAEPASEAHTTAENVHELGEEGAWITATTREAWAASTEATDILAFGLDGELASPK